MNVTAEPLAGTAAEAHGNATNNASDNASTTDTAVWRRLILPVEVFRNSGMITPDAPKSHIAEEYRAIKRPLLLNMDHAEAGSADLRHVIMVTSCVEGEGKTFSAINLAMSLAMERDNTVLFIDADVAKGSASALLGFGPGEAGLTSLLLDPQSSIEDHIWQTDIENMACIPVGPTTEHATELLASDRMRAMIRRLAEHRPDRIIVFDAPPVLVTNEAIALTRQVGQIAFVVAAESTTHGMVTDALAGIRGTAQIGLLLNKARKKFGSRAFGYGDSYGYGYGHSRAEPAGVRPGGHH